MEFAGVEVAVIVSYFILLFKLFLLRTVTQTHTLA
jgi:hypothetical protein